MAAAKRRKRASSAQGASDAEAKAAEFGARAEFFATPADFRAWLREHHERRDELIVGYWKKATGKPSITWPESVEQALCFGWIDGLRRRIDEESYGIRFTPRRPKSQWSQVNIDMMARLLEAGQVEPAGLAAWERHIPAEQTQAVTRAEAELSTERRTQFQEDAEAWAFFETLPPGHRKRAVHWVESARREATRARRLDQLMESCRKGERRF